MSEQSSKIEITAEAIIRGLPLLPIMGFVFALTYEASFFFWLGIEPRQILTLTDIAKASALKIVPAIPLYFIVVLFSVWTQTPRIGTTKLKQVKNIIGGVLLFFGFIFLILSPILYLLFGFMGGIGFLNLGFSIFMMIYIFIVSPLLLRIGPTIPFAFTLLSLAISLFVILGIVEADRIRFEDRSTLPLVTTEIKISEAALDQLLLVRRLSSGILVATNKKNRMWFVQNDSPTVLTFMIDPIPFKGIACYAYDWCPELLSPTKGIYPRSK